jgi:hypothetical protein
MENSTYAGNYPSIEKALVFVYIYISLAVNVFEMLAPLSRSSARLVLTLLVLSKPLLLALILSNNSASPKVRSGFFSSKEVNL